MNQKVTRRAVLGTTIAALVAGPFVMRELRNKRTVSLPYVDREETHSDIESEWNALRERFLHEWKGLCQPLETTKYSGTKDREIAINLAGLQTKKFTFVDTTVLGLVSSREECTPENLLGYRVGNGVMQTHGEDGSLLLSTENYELRYVKYSDGSGGWQKLDRKWSGISISF